MCHQLDFNTSPVLPLPPPCAEEGQGPKTGPEKEEGHQEGAPKSDI